MLYNPSHTWHLSLGDSVLDRFLEGGLDVDGSITEIAGEAGAGKTQLALQLMLQAQLPSPHGGLGGGAVYLHGDTSNVEPALKRLHTIAEAFAARHASMGADVEMLKSRIFVMQVDSPEDLWQVIDERLSTFLREQPVRLIVIDSLGGLYRGADAPTGSAHAGAAANPYAAQAEQAKQRARLVLKLAARLKYISSKSNVAVVVLNQVTDKPFDDGQYRAAAPWERSADVCGLPDGGGARVPALGPAWASCVNSRLVLTRRTADAASGQHWARQMHVAWSPRMGQRSVDFTLADHGLVGPVR